MSQLSIMIRELTDNLNEIVENIDYEKDEDNEIVENIDYEKDEDNENNMTILFKASIILEDISKLIKGHPVARYDYEINKSYLLYPDGRRKY